jgi:exosortase
MEFVCNLMNTTLNFKSKISANKGLLILILIFSLTVGVIYGNDLAILANEAVQNEAGNYILLLPFFAVFLFYLKKDVVKATVKVEKQKKSSNIKYMSELSGIVLCLIAFMIYWYGSYTFYPLEYHLLSLPVFIMGSILFLSNPRTLRVLLFPSFFLFFIIPIPSSIIYTVGGALANFNTQISYSILKAFGLPLTLDTSYGAPTIILNTAAGHSANFTVDVACSGIYSIVAFTMFATFLAFILSTKLYKKIAIFVLGLITFAAINLVRITTIFSVGYAFGEQVAMTVHSFAGIVLLFVGMIAILFISEKVFKTQLTIKPQPQTPCPQCKTKMLSITMFCQNCGRLLDNKRQSISKTTLGKMLLLLLLCTVAIASVQAPTFATAKNTLELASTDNPGNSTSVLPQVPGYTLEFLYPDTQYAQISGQDASLMYAYFPNNNSGHVIYADIGVASSLSNLHNWEVCLFSFQTAQGNSPLATKLESRDTLLIQNPPVTAQYLVFQNPSPANTTQLTVYWYEKVPFKNGLTTEQKYVRISLIIMISSSDDYKKYEPELMALSQPVAQAWEPLKSQAILSLGVPAQQALLVFLIVFLFSAQTAQYVALQRKRSNMMKIFDNYASAKEKILFKTTLKLTGENKIVKTKDIIEAIEKKVQKPVNHKRVEKMLRTLQAEGFIRTDVVSIGNSPVLVWKV